MTTIEDVLAEIIRKKVSDAIASLPEVSQAHHVLVRTANAGVHVGCLKSRTGSEVILTNAHRIWRWKGANTLHELANNGASLTEYTRVSESIPVITVLGVAEIIELSSSTWANLSTPRWL